MANSLYSLHDHLLDLDVVAVDEADHVDACGGLDVDVGAAYLVGKRRKED